MKTKESINFFSLARPMSQPSPDFAKPLSLLSSFLFSSVPSSPSPNFALNKKSHGSDASSQQAARAARPTAPGKGKAKAFDAGESSKKKNQCLDAFVDVDVRHPFSPFVVVVLTVQLLSPHSTNSNAQADGSFSVQVSRNSFEWSRRGEKNRRRPIALRLAAFQSFFLGFAGVFF